MKNRTRRRGFALFTVLWSLSLCGLAAAHGRAEGATAIDASRYRVDAIAGGWRARACLAEARAALNELLRADSRHWQRLDEVTLSLSDRECAIAAHAQGTRLNVNSIDSLTLLSLLAATQGEARAESLAAALLDWRDVDSIARPAGAEAPWYRAQQRPLPSDTLLRAAEEIALVRGWALIDERHLLDVEPARIAVLHAPPRVLRVLPGFSDAAVAHVERQRARLNRPTDIRELILTAPPNAARELERAFVELQAVAVLAPDEWILRASVPSSRDGFRVTVEQRLGRVASGVVPLGEQQW